MQIQLATLAQSVQFHPAEVANGMMIAALVTAAVQRSSVLKNSTLARSALSGTLGLAMGAGAAFVATQSDLAGKLLFTASAVASIGFGYLYVVSRTGSAAARMHRARSPAAPEKSAIASASAAGASVAQEGNPYLQKGFFGLLIERISENATSEGIFRVSGSKPTIDRIYNQLHPKQAPRSKNILKRLPSIRSKARAGASAALTQADARGIFEETDINVLVGLLKKSLQECPTYQHLLANIQDDLIQQFSSACTTKQIKNLIDKLEPEQKEPLKAIIELLAKIADENELMDADKLATCIASNFFMPSDNLLDEVTWTPYQNAAVSFMIQNYKEVFDSIEVKSARS